MYLRSLSVDGVRLLADQVFKFTKTNGEARLWTVIIADNGYCKSTIQQAIALAASGPRLASELASDSTAYRRDPNDDAGIGATFGLPKSPDRAWPPKYPKSTTVGSKLVSGEGRHDFVDAEGNSRSNPVLDEVRARRLAGWFVMGFGVGRFLPKPGEVAAPTNPVADRVKGLFDPRHKMLATHFYEVFKQLEKQSLATHFAKQLRDILLFETKDGKLLEWLDAVELRGKPGLKETSRLLAARRFKLKLPGRSLEVNATSLSDGYQSMVAWIADLLGHALLDAGRPMGRDELTGIVLVDEIDLHLHPTWQRRVVPILRRVFPKLQFIVTTHSPLVLGGFEAEEIIRLELKDGLIVQADSVPEPGMQSASEVLGSFFDVPRAQRQSLIDDERRYLLLHGRRKRTAAEGKELHQLQGKLSRYWANGVDHDEQGDEADS